MKKHLLTAMLAVGLMAPVGVQAATNPFSTPPKNMQASQTMQINSFGNAPGIPAPPGIMPEQAVMQEDVVHAAAMPIAKTTPSTGSNTWLALSIGMILLALGGFFGMRYSKKN